MKIMIAYFIILFCITSCSKQLKQQQIKSMDGFGENVNMEEIKTAYNNLISAENKNPRNLISKKADLSESVIHWQDARLHLTDNVIIVQFSQKKRIFLLQDDGSAISYDNASYLIVSRKNGQYKFEIMTKIADLTYLTNYQEIVDFSGKLIFEDIYGHFTKGYTVSQGKMDGSLIKKTQKKSESESIVIKWYAAADSMEARSIANPTYTEYYEMDQSNPHRLHGDFYTSIGEYRLESTTRYVFPDIKRTFKLITGY